MESLPPQEGKTMEGLPDDILIEICCRLPCKIAVRCKSFSKRFLALISSHLFVERFIHYKRTLFFHINEEEREKEWSFNFLSRHNVLILLQPKLHNPEAAANWSLRFLGPQFDPNLEYGIDACFGGHPTIHIRTEVLGSSNGLLLVTKSTTPRDYYICNPITKDWVKLPSPSQHLRQCELKGRNCQTQYHVGFICEPYYHVEGDKVTLSSCHRFRVVLLPFLKTFTPTAQFELQFSVFSSETGEWSTKLALCPEGFCHNYPMKIGTALLGRIYFLGERSLLALDPFSDNNLHCQTIDLPAELDGQSVAYNGHLGVSCGSIRICDAQLTSKVASVWELNEAYGGGGWRLVHRASLPRMKREDCVRAEHGKTRRLMRVLAFHPTHGDVVFFQRGHLKFFGNLKTEEFQPVTYGHDSFQTTPLDMPWWPTPVPAIKGNLLD